MNTDELFAAVRAGDGEAVAVALQAGADARAKRSYEMPVDREVVTGTETVLQAAVATGDLAIVDLLLAHGADVDARDEATGATALVQAVRRGQQGIVQALLRAGASPELADGRAGEDALGAAAMAGQGAVAEALLAGGARPSARTLELACHAGQLDLAARCVAAGIDPATTDALAAACRVGRIAVVEWLLANGLAAADAGEALGEAVHAGHTEVVACLLRHGAPVDVGNGYGWTPLFFAGYGARADLVRMLLAAGADPARVDQQGHTAAHWAAEAGASDCVSLLRAAGEAS